MHEVCAGECVSFGFRQSGVGACMHACKLPRSRVGTYRKNAVVLLNPPECEPWCRRYFAKVLTCLSNGKKIFCDGAIDI